MDDTQRQHERAVGDTLIKELNRKRGTDYAFYRRGNEGPDLIYRDGRSQIGLEIVTCYYDSNDAEYKWKNARTRTDAPKRWSGVNFDETLVMNINKALQAKCSKHYGPNCLLAVSISPNLTTFNEMNELLPNIEIPPEHQFVGIYLIGHFGVSSDCNVNHAIWKLFPNLD